MRIHSLAIKNFPPFAEGSEIVFPDKPKDSQKAEVHLLVGPNGSGKTRLLSLVCASLGNGDELRKRVDSISELRAAVSGHHNGEFLGVWTTENQVVERSRTRTNPSALGWLTKPPDDLISSRSTFISETRSDAKKDNERAIALAFDARHALEDTPVDPSKWLAVGTEPSLVKLELDAGDPIAITNNLACICQLALNEIGLASLPVKPSVLSHKWSDVKTRLEESLSRITHQQCYLYLRTGTETFLGLVWGQQQMRIAQLPDGIRSILGWLGGCISKLCHLYPEHPSPLDIPFVLLIDEPETHLHPKWQRHILVAAQDLFPNAQIIAATHSAFAIASVDVGHLHVLHLDTRSNLVKPKPAEPCPEGDTYIDAVEDALELTPYERYAPETAEDLKRFDELRDLILKGDWTHEPEVLGLADKLWARNSLSLRNRVGRDLYNLDQARRTRPSKGREGAAANAAKSTSRTASTKAKRRLRP